jgi:hypothetical protein
MSFLYMMDDYPAHTAAASGSLCGTPLSMLEMHSKPVQHMPQHMFAGSGIQPGSVATGIPMPQMQQGPMQPAGPVMFGGAPSFSSMAAQFQPAYQNYQMQQANTAPELVKLAANKIRGLRKLMKYIGSPDLVDAQRGGIAIWSRNTLRKRKYPFLRRVEIIDEHVYNSQPVPHYSNIYIWVHVRLSSEMLSNVHELSKDFFYDRNKELLIVRSDSLDTAVAQAAVVLLYSRGRISYYSVVNNNLLKKYYEDANKRKTRRAVYTVLSKAR